MWGKCIWQGDRELCAWTSISDLHVPHCLGCICLPQLINMYWALLQLGRRLVLPAGLAGVSATYEEVLQYREPDDSNVNLTIDLMFPASAGTIQRLMSSWWEAKVRVDSICVCFWQPICIRCYVEQHACYMIHMQWQGLACGPSTEC